MTYSLFERLTLAVGAITVVGTLVAGTTQQPMVEEMVAQVLLLVVLAGAVHWGRNGGFSTAIGASFIYVMMRVPLFIQEGYTPEIAQMILIRIVTYGIIGLLGGELCMRVKYIFASMEDARSLDHVTGVFNEQFIGRRLRKCLAEHERYGTSISAAVLTLDPGLYLPLRKLRQRQILRSVASRIRNDIRLVDDLGRLNDSRFLILLPNTPREGALVAAERVRVGVRDLLGALDESVSVSVMGMPGDAVALDNLVVGLDLRDPEPVSREVART